MQLCHILGEFKQIRIKATIVSSIKSKMDSVPCLTEIRALQCNRGSCRVQYQFDSEQVSFGPIWLRYTHLNTIRVPSDSYYGDQEKKATLLVCEYGNQFHGKLLLAQREAPALVFGQKINLVEFCYSTTRTQRLPTRLQVSTLDAHKGCTRVRLHQSPTTLTPRVPLH
jgi:hypothetical protein